MPEIRTHTASIFPVTWCANNQNLVDVTSPLESVLHTLGTRKIPENPLAFIFCNTLRAKKSAHYLNTRTPNKIINASSSLLYLTINLDQVVWLELLKYNSNFYFILMPLQNIVNSVIYLWSLGAILLPPYTIPLQTDTKKTTR